jgi:hypothetical protein
VTRNLSFNQKQTIIGALLSCICTFLFQTSIASTNAFYTIHESVSNISRSSLALKSELHLIKSKKSSRHVIFVLCESCFWCASSIYSDLRIHICPVCGNSTNWLSIKGIEDNKEPPTEWFWSNLHFKVA